MWKVEMHSCHPKELYRDYLKQRQLSEARKSETLNHFDCEP